MRSMKEALEETVTVGKVAVIIGLVAFGLLMYFDYVDCWAAMPKEAQVEIDQTVESMLSEGGISVFQKAYLRNEFVKCVSFGGAGGMGNNVVGSGNAQDFVETIQHNNIKEVYCVYEYKKDGHRFTKRYWALSPGGTHELRQVYAAPNGWYSLKEYTESAVTFEVSNDNAFAYWVVTIIVCAIIGVLIGLVARVVLGYAYPYRI